VAAAVIAIAWYARARSSKRAAAEALHRRGLDSYTAGMALHDEAAVLPMTPEADRARVLGEVSASVDRVTGQFDALATDPGSQGSAAEIEAVQLALGSLRGALQAQVGAGAIDAQLLRERLAGLESALERFRQRVSPPATGAGP
jgi:hypothetical protein